MPASFVRSSRLFPGVPYAYAAAAPGTGVIFTAGACPLDEQGRVVAPGDIASEIGMVAHADLLRPEPAEAQQIRSVFVESTF